MESAKILPRVCSLEGVEWIKASEMGQLRIAAHTERRLVLLHDTADSSACDIHLEQGARLELTELFTAEAFRSATITQQADSRSELTLLMLGSANVEMNILLEDERAESRLSALFLAAEGEHCEVALRTEHRAPDCRSNSLVKGVASGKESFGRFRGMVYVAPDAQRTDARQTSRNIELTAGARIRTEPQLEIYADDVKCSHGATVGQLDGEAILYMRQRGLTKQQARRLQIEGFASDVVCHHKNEQLAELLCELVSEKLQTM